MERILLAYHDIISFCFIDITIIPAEKARIENCKENRISFAE